MLKALMKLITAVAGALITFLFSGCAVVGHKDFYSQVSPTKYPPTEQVMIFEYQNMNLKGVYDLLFSDFLIIGRSSFVGPYEEPTQALSFAKSIGADVFIVNSQFKSTQTSMMSMVTPTTSVTNVSGYSGGQSFYGTATSYGTTTTNIPITVSRYNQDGYYLRNVNKTIPLWEKKEDQFVKSVDGPFGGIWFNENYKIKIFQTNDQVVGFVAAVTGKDQSKFWKDAQLKFIFGVSGNLGIYMMGNKTPMPASFAINKFGHFEVKLIESGEVFSFARAD